VHTEPETVAIQHEYTTDSTYLSRMARTSTAFALSRPFTVVLLLIVGIMGLTILIPGLISGRPVAIVFSLVYVLAAPIVAAITYVRTVRGNARRVPVGSRMAVGLGENSMRTEGPLGESNLSYRSYSRAYLRGDFVILRIQGVRSWTIFPRELFPGTDFYTLQDAISRANA
jgi:hypothetical protein